MKKPHYDFVVLTNTPSFYKLNLFHEIARFQSVLLVFYGYGDEAVNGDLLRRQWNFDYKFIFPYSTHKRNRLTTLLKLIQLLNQISYTRILYSGWYAFEYSFISFFLPKAKNAIICESSIYEVSHTGLKSLIKRAIIGRMSYALVSGTPHKTLFERLKFKGKIIKTGSVGIINMPALTRTPIEPKHELRFLYVGRLIDVKNIDLLIDVFNNNGLPLTIVGKGINEQRLKQRAKSNIHFLGFVDNNRLGQVYQQHDVFILPSYYEPWGLVVEEAIYYGLPVIVSDKVGSSIDMVKNLNTGIIFQSGDSSSLQNAIESISNTYTTYQENVRKVDFTKRNNQQVQAYLKILAQ